MLKKSIFKISAFLTAITMLTGCAPLLGMNKNQDGTREAVAIVDGKYDTTLTVTAVRFLPSIVQFPEGDDVENNVWTRAFEDKLNIKLKYLWTVPSSGEAFDQKINIAIASNDLPDIIPVYTSLYEKLAQADKLYDLTGVLEKYGSEDLKKNLEASDSRALKASMRNGKLTGIGILPDTVPSAMVWVRDDWMKKLGLKDPETMDDFINMARAFANNDPDGNGKKDTWGFALDKELKGISGFFNAYRAYDKIWMDVDGELQFSSTLPAVKEPLRILNQLYTEKVIDPEFPYKSDSDQIKADIISGRIGMIIGNASSPMTNIGAAYKNDGVDWRAFPMPSANDQPILLQIASRIGDFVTVNKNCKNPEAMIKMMNLGTEIKYGNPDWITNNDFHTTKDGYMAFFYPPISFPPNRAGDDVLTSSRIAESLKTGETSIFNQEQLTYYKKVKGFIDKTEDADWSTYKVFGPNGSMSIKANYKANNNILIDENFLAETPAWSQNGANLYSRTKEFYTMAIMEGNLDKTYDDYVNYFNNQGGAEATKEINELYKGQQRLNK